MLRHELRRFLWEDEGTEVVEWAVIALVLLAFTVPVILLVGGQLRSLMCSMFGALGGDVGQCSAQ